MSIEENDFKQYLTIKRRLAPKSIHTYLIRFRLIKRWLLDNSKELNRQSVEDFLYQLKERKLSNSAINTYSQTLNHIERYSRDRGLLEIGFMEGIESLPKTSPEINPLTPEETERLLNTHLEYKNRNGVDCSDLDEKYLTLTGFISISGCRFGEAATLKIKRLDIENERAFLVNTKNKHNRYIFFKGYIKEKLRKLIEGRDGDDLVFVNSKGEYVKPGDFNNDLRRRAAKAGIEKYVHAHILRHSYATELYKSTHDLATVKTVLGHEDIKTTEVYVHLDTDYLQRTVSRHPLMRKYMDTDETMRLAKETLDSLHLGEDGRFLYSVIQENGLLKIELKIK